ncbi:hypothetical protein SB6408_05258 [Klebsiella spallanzanii]|uniref:Uncharacterized protein n=1 Tax=Klebsiella spallanzanii TaxID=2587528 RepID=A0A564L3W4_9ENTR|nr:hypothetical protein SB6408_05258 [Klebsiella spallanzanii]
MCSWFSGMMFGGFVVFFGRLSFLGYSGFSSSFVVFFSGLSFLGYCGFSGSFVVLFGRLSFLLCGRFSSGFVVFLVVSCFSGGAVSCSSRSWSGSSGSVGSKSNRRQTHSSGNDQS